MKFKISITLYCRNSSYILVELLKFIFMTTITLESENEKKRVKASVTVRVVDFL